MIWFLSDQHGGERMGELEKYLSTASDSDLLIILGDVGLRFADTEENRRFDEIFLSSDKNIAFIDGNHENFSYLYSFPIEKWHGGEVHRITENIVHLMRGNIYEIEGSSFFVFGGCKSSNKWKESNPWQPEEIPTEEELNRAYCNLKKHGNRVDYILTHKHNHRRGTVTEELVPLEDYIENEVEYRHWYAGHWHKNAEFDEKHTYVYDVLIKLKQ